MFPQSEPSGMEVQRCPSNSASSSCYEMSPPSTIRGDSTDFEDHTLQLASLEKYSRANDCLSNLRSSSGSVSSGVSVHGAAEDAATAAKGWQAELSSMLGTDRTDKWTGSLGLNPRHFSLTSRSHQYDGTSEDLGRPLSPARLMDTSDESRRTMEVRNKRKASIFSLRRDGPTSRKRRRPPTVLQKFADTISQKLTNVRQKFRRRGDPPGPPNSFAAWKAAREQAQREAAANGQGPANLGSFRGALAGPSETSLAGATGNGSGAGSEWWSEGVCKYAAPPWIAFSSPHETMEPQV